MAFRNSTKKSGLGSIISITSTRDSGKFTFVFSINGSSITSAEIESMDSIS